MSNRTPLGKTNAPGVLLVLFGIAFFLHNFDLIPSDVEYYLFNWRGVLLLVGIVFLSIKPNKVPGIIMVSIAVFLISTRVVQDYFGHYVSFREVFWPALMIVVGFALLANRKKERDFFTSGASSRDELHDTSIFGGGDVVVRSSEFRGGKVTAIFGGSSYDLTQSQLADGTNYLEMFAMFGGHTFVVPSDWDVQVEITSIFGGFCDRRKHIRTAEVQSQGVLHLKGIVLFGGGELKNF